MLDAFSHRNAFWDFFMKDTFNACSDLAKIRISYNVAAYFWELPLSSLKFLLCRQKTSFWNTARKNETRRQENLSLLYRISYHKINLHTKTAFSVN